jgi:hypothetical protein
MNCLKGKLRPYTSETLCNKKLALIPSPYIFSDNFRRFASTQGRRV